jgi:glycosyltransferase involved in cell wall biosynthesis
MALLVEGISVQPGLSVEALLFNEGRLADVLRAAGISVTVIPESGQPFWKLALSMRGWLKSRDFDVAHAHRYKEILATAVALPSRGPGLVVTVHGLEPSVQLRRNRVFLIWGSLVVGWLVGAKIVAVSAELRIRLGRFLGHRRVFHIPNPMPPLGIHENLPDLRRRFGWSASRPLVGFVGRLEYVKGPDIFIEVAMRCQIEAGFVLVGGGSLAATLSARVTESGAGDRVAFVGEVPDAMPYIRQLDVLAVSSRHEGLPLVLLEAAASEVPIVAFDVGGVREVVRESGPSAKLVPAADRDGFLRAVEEILRHRDAARTEVAGFAESVRARFNLATISAAYCDLYRTIVHRNR